MPERKQLLLLVLVLVALATGLVAVRLGNDTPPPIELVRDSGLEPGTPIQVHVTGAVITPGVYELRAGDRVLDAVTAAGGPAPGADLDALNLARRLRDEDQIVVPGGQRPKSTSSTALGNLIDINIATEDELDSLPGIGEAYARRIVDSRAVDGPFETTEELVDRGVIPASTFDKIRDLVVAGP